MGWKAWVAAVAIGLATPAAAGPVDELGWLAGAWISEDGQRWTEELWMAPRGGVMLGTNRSGKDGKAGGFEFMRIAADADGTVSFWGSPGGKPAVPFRLVSSGPGEAVFENPDHDFPTRVAYQRAGPELLATVSGPNGTNAQSWRFRRPLMLAPPPVPLER